MKSKTLKKWDFIVLAAVLLCSAAAFLCLNTFNNNKGSYALVEVNGETVAELSLDENTVYEVKINGKTTNIVEIKDNKADVTFADCPDKICENHKAIGNSGESIVCLPNRVVVSIKGSNGKQLDGVVQ